MKPAHYFVLAVLIGAALLVAVQPATAHHSGAEFSDKTTEITGTIREFQFKNPHTWIQILVDAPNGKKEEWSIEWGAPNSLARQGYRPTTFPAGSKVTMRIHPMKDGSPAAGFVAAKFADGKTIGKWE
jgi:hypothetical protein